MNTKIMVIADDVTGAADSAARCYNAGLTAVIDLTATADSPPPPNEQSATLALSTDSRFLPPTAAAERVTQLLRPLVKTQPDRPITQQTTRWYKKIDSTLRGNIGSELAAMLPLVTPSHAAPCAIISPAFPAQQRTLVDGYLCYAGLPPHSVHLPTLLAAQCDLPVTTIALETVRGPRAELEERLRTAHRAGTTLIVIDAESEEDLQRLLTAATATIPHALLCGSAGLVGVLAETLVAAQEPQPLATESQSTTVNNVRQSTATAVKHPILAVVGSGSAMAQSQLAFLRAQHKTTVFTVEPQHANSHQKVLSSVKSAQPSITGTSLPSTDLVLCLPIPTEETHLEGEIARQYATALAETVQALLPVAKPATLLLVGGDTAVQTLTKLGIRRLQVVRELLPGMPLATARDHQGAEYQIILKAGNHGDETTLAHLLQH